VHQGGKYVNEKIKYIGFPFFDKKYVYFKDLLMKTLKIKAKIKVILPFWQVLIKEIRYL